MRTLKGIIIHAVCGEAGVESLHGVTVGVGVPQGDNMAEEDFERAFGFGHIRPILAAMRKLYNQKPQGFGSLRVGVGYGVASLAQRKPMSKYVESGPPGPREKTRTPCGS